MYAVASLPAFKRLQIAWVAASVLSSTAGQVLFYPPLVGNPTLVVTYLLVALMLGLVGLAQMAVLYWWQRGAGIAVFDLPTMIWWVSIWSLGGIVSIPASAAGLVELGLLVGLCVVPLAQALLLRSWAWLGATVLGAIAGWLIALMMLVILWGMSEKGMFENWHIFVAWLLCILPYCIFTSRALCRIIRLRLAAAQPAGERDG